VQNQDQVPWFRDIRIGDVALVGGKNASLGELYAVLSREGIRIPNGFALSAQAYRDALTKAAAWDKLYALLELLLCSRLWVPCRYRRPYRAPNCFTA